MADRAAAVAIEQIIEKAATLARFHPRARRQRAALDIVRDVPYLPSGERAHLLDIYRPTNVPGPWPICVYVHGGSFRILSKETHWVPAVQFARNGYLTFVVNYRLAPAAKFPSALEDIAHAIAWVMANAFVHGGDTSRLVVAGESAGANLALAYAIACTYERDEAYARAIFDSGFVPQAIVPACGILQVSAPERFVASEATKVAGLIYGRIAGVGTAYMPEAHTHWPSLMDPLLILEQASERPVRAFPVVAAGVGDRDPIGDDTRRLGTALERLGVTHAVTVYPGGHAFEMLVWREAARRYWRDTMSFLHTHVGRAERAV
jgi:acetyl esterase